MRKIKFNSKLGKIILASGIMATVAVPQAFAADDNWIYDFTINPYQQNTTNNWSYRQTNNTENPWKVENFDSDEPGGNTITRFWMEEKLVKSRCTNKIDALERAGAYYDSVYSRGNEVDVRLVAENNNFNTNTYTVSGWWDEETW